MKKGIILFLFVFISSSVFALTPVVLNLGGVEISYFEEYFELFDQVEEFDSAHVDRVVDGDTVKVSMKNFLATVRLIGLDTPETVHPSKPVEYFGKEASNFAKSILDNQNIKLSYDWDRYDKYDRLLAYVWIPVSFEGSTKYVLFNLLAIINGYGHAYLQFSFRDEYMNIFSQAQKYARENNLGLWSNESGETVTNTTKVVSSNAADIRISMISYYGNPEYIEIKNYGSSAVNLSGWKVTDEDEKHKYVFGSVELEPGYIIRLYSGNKANKNIWTKVYIWNNDGDTGYLYDSNENLVDDFAY